MSIDSSRLPSPDDSTATGALAQEPEAGFPIVGLGASAGGLGAFQTFFSALPPSPEPGMAFVLIQHLSPEHPSLLPELIQRCTSLQVLPVEDGMVARPNCVYVIPPNHNLALRGGSLWLLKPEVNPGPRHPVDFFFRSLAQELGNRAICVVLSGSGCDGTSGLKAVKDAGGLVLAQTPESCEFDGMPRSAIATDSVDFVLPPEKMPAQLLEYAACAFSQPLGSALLPPAQEEDTLRKICFLLRDQTGHDFSQYKRNTLIRRIERRMAVNQILRLEDYLRHLRTTPTETQALFQDLLIGVTCFFRDGEAFSSLATDMIPKLIARASTTPGRPLRIWICGCASGEEAYSIAILLHEHLETLQTSCKVQIFATDIDPRAIEQARAGVYPAAIAADISPRRMDRYFTPEPNGDSFRIRKSIRDLLIFSEQDVIKDPPFSHLDLISCRNLLIYLNADLQKKLIPLFHYALNPQGLLFLGNSESIGPFEALFTPLDRKHKLFQRKETEPGARRQALGVFSPLPAGRTALSRASRTRVRTDESRNRRELTEQTLLAHYAHSAALINSRGEILHIHGRTGQFLEPAAGDANMNILSMAREGLRPAMINALYQVVARQAPLSHPVVQVRSGKDSIPVNLHLLPAVNAEGAAQPDLYLAILEEAPSPASPADGEPAIVHAPGAVTDESRRVAILEQELRTKEEYLQSTLEEMESSTEELKSTNEEMQSINEELQSANEEMETSKEELQAVNEELATVNSELQTKVADLSRANNDMNNLLAGTGVATLFVDHHLRITRFTPSAVQLINLIPSDIGRPVGHIVSNLEGYDRLIEDVQGVLHDLTPREAEVRTRNGDWFLMNIRPYRTLENVIEGAVITFVDLTERKRMEESVRFEQTIAESLVNTVREPLLVLDGTFRVLSANRGFYSAFRLAPQGVVGESIFEMSEQQWNLPELHKLLEELLPEWMICTDFKITPTFGQLGKRTLLLNARRIPHPGGNTEVILLAIEDISIQTNEGLPTPKNG